MFIPADSVLYSHYMLVFTLMFYFKATEWMPMRGEFHESYCFTRLSSSRNINIILEKYEVTCLTFVICLCLMSSAKYTIQRGIIIHTFICKLYKIFCHMLSFRENTAYKCIQKYILPSMLKKNAMH